MKEMMEQWKRNIIRKRYQEEIRIYIELMCEEKNLTKRAFFHQGLLGYIEALWNTEIISYKTYERYKKIATEVYMEVYN